MDNEYPLPTNDTDGQAAYDLDNTTAYVSMSPDGSYYLQAHKFDFSTRSADDMRRKLKDYGAEYIGWEND